VAVSNQTSAGTTAGKMGQNVDFPAQSLAGDQI